MAAQPSPRTVVARPAVKKTDSGEVSLGSRQTQELILALVGPIGSGVSTTASLLSEILKDTYDYEVELVKISGVIAGDAYKVSHDIEKSGGVLRIENLQKIGNALRDRYGADYLAKRVVEGINGGRESNVGADNDVDSPFKNAKPRRRVTIIDSLKHPEELNILRRVYGDLFYTFCIFAPEDVRMKRVQKGSIRRSDVDRIFEVDEYHGSDCGQRVRDTSFLADFFIRNDLDNQEQLRTTVDRYLEIIFGTKIHTPQLDETAMYGAIVAARGSACLSRQVGAVIYSADGELIGQGCNDVPKAGGGLYEAEDGQNDHRCYKWKGRVCHNDTEKGERYDEIVLALQRAGLVSGDRLADVKKVVASTRLKDLIEFSRAVHAEMEAIISVARNANDGLVGSTLYCTTFPCHNCARHIVASGISRVVYVEPYAKSLATKLHDDSLAASTTTGDHVIYQQYQGVAPRNIDRYFGVRGERKRLGKLVETPSREAVPVGLAPLDGIAIRETLVIAEAASNEVRLGANLNVQGKEG